MRQTSYSAELKESIIRRLQGPNPQKISELSADTGISLSTLYQWRKQALSQNPGTPHDTSPHLRSAEEKWHLVKRAQELEGQELGVFLRQEGVHPPCVRIVFASLNTKNYQGARSTVYNETDQLLSGA